MTGGLGVVLYNILISGLKVVLGPCVALMGGIEGEGSMGRDGVYVAMFDRYLFDGAYACLR